MVYQVINNIFESSKVGCTAAEAHGMAAGMLCVNDRAQSLAWLNELFQDLEPLPDDQQALLSRLFDETARLISGDEFEFDVLLPSEETALTVRIEALKSWCQGFLFGVGAVVNNPQFSSEAAEILKDITEFTRLDSDADGEEDENAFVEVTEYLRSAVLLLHEELSSQSSETLH